jgi:acetyl esterase/lipase
MTRRKEENHSVASLRLWAAVILFLASLLAVMPAQTYNLWKASIAGAELGHFIAILGIVTLLIPFWWRSVPGQLAGGITVVAIGLGLSPTIRAYYASRGLETRLGSAFGTVPPRSSDKWAAMKSPVSLRNLLRRPPQPNVDVKTLIYTTRDDKPLELDFYRAHMDSAARSADSTATTPLVITIHGGSWSSGSRKELPQLNYYLAVRGYAVAAVGYRLAPANPFPAATDDVNAAIDYLKSHARSLGVDSSRIVLVGRSAGGQLALQSAYTKNDPAIKGVAALYAPSDQIWGWEHPTNTRVYDSFAVLRNFLHGEPSEIHDAYIAASPINYIGSHTIPTLLLHGSMDPLVSVKQSERLDSALSLMKRPHLLVEMPWATHGCDYVFYGPCGQTVTFAIERFVASVTK